MFQLSNPAVEAALRAHLQAVGDLLIHERGPTVEMREDYRDRWLRGGDGAFRPEKLRSPSLLHDWFRYEERSHGLQTFTLLMEAIRADPVLSPQFEASVGAAGGAERLDFDRLVGTMLWTLIDTDRGELAFRDDRFKSRWEAIARDLYEDTLNCVTVVLLPGLTVPGALPVELAPNLEITALSDAEVTRAVSCGLLRPTWAPLIPDIEARAIRHTKRLPKLINAAPNLSVDEGVFGQRPSLMFHLLADDVLSALRLVKVGRLRSPGVIQYVDSWLLEAGTSFHDRGGRPFGHGQLALEATDIKELQAVWMALTSDLLRRRRLIAAGLRRFNMAADRDSVEDSIVDLMIAAESLFLSDTAAPADRGELSFRFAQRAALFVDWSAYSHREIFDLAATAYRIRNTIVHGGRLREKEVRLPRKGPVSVGVFRDAVEELMRLAIRKALNEAAKVRDFGDREYWLTRLFPPMTPLT